ncbi:amino acid ABC transporter substrate-binding protein [Geminocystis herdmanii]|uniref:amino acid ABC transporter substrate-binding protein n=1 Tax=Geminocystis herdmanii TaxID=669359 RepID=UPI0003646DF3|nr:amino acid ABC transporter substrate-binding protein [Geminocystis herdmanii]
MIIKHKIIKTFLTVSICTLGLFPMVDVKGETILEEINRTGLLKVGVRNDAIPFGYRVNGELRGICVDVIRIIREELRNKLDRDIISINLVVSSLDNRFSIVENNVVHFECGPNTIRKLEDYQVSFSEPFFLSGIKFIVAKDKQQNLINSDGKDFTIGLLKNTTTEIFIKEKYPQANFELFQGLRGSERGLQALKQGRIDAFADDGILLLGQSIAQRLPLGENHNFILAPDPPFTCEKYGLIIPQNDPDWENFVNNSVNLEQKMGIINNWFKDFLPSISTKNTIEKCQLNISKK